MTEGLGKAIRYVANNRLSVWIAASLTSALLVATPGGEAHAAAVIAVPGDYATIQAAIAAAADGDTVRVAPGTYQENINFLGKAIVVESTGGADVTTIDGGGSGSVVSISIAEGLAATIRGFTITNGAAGQGGGIDSSGPVTIDDNVITGNRASAATGAGVSVSGSGTVVTANTIRDNGNSGGSGGTGGAGILVIGASNTEIRDNIVVGNTGSSEGGGISLFATSGVTISANLIAGNDGGISELNSSGNVILNNFIVDNPGGAAIAWTTPSGNTGPVVVNNTIVGENSSGVVASGGFDASASLVNNIIYANSGAALSCSEYYDTSGPATSHNDLISVTAAPVTGDCSGTIGANGNISVDPRFADPSRAVYRLRIDSPVVDRGTTPPIAVPVDYYGHVRPIDGDLNGSAGYDLGAYELARDSGYIAGRVIDDLTGDATADVCVDLTTTGGSVVESGVTAGDGTFAIPADAGSHKLRFYDCRGIDVITEWFDDAASSSVADVVVVTGTVATNVGDVRVGIDRPIPGGGRFFDDDGIVHEASIEAIAAAGITKGCNPPYQTAYCPSAPVTRGQMAAFLVRALDLSDTGGGNSFVDDDGSVFEADIARLAAAGITKGCNPPVNDHFCPNDRVTRGQMAAFLVRALAYTDGGAGDLFTDDDGSVFESQIDRLAVAGVTKGCNPPANDHFCPNDFVTRAEMATFLTRALDLRSRAVPERLQGMRGTELDILGDAESRGCSDGDGSECSLSYTVDGEFHFVAGWYAPSWSSLTATQRSQFLSDKVRVDAVFDDVPLTLPDPEVIYDGDQTYKIYSYSFPDWLEGNHVLEVITVDEVNDYKWTAVVTITARGPGYQGLPPTEQWRILAPPPSLRLEKWAAP